MKSPAYADDSPIAAPATPLLPSALAVLRVSGPGSLDILEKLFSRPSALAGAPSGQALHGWFMDPSDSSRLDEVVLLPWKAPHGYTGEDGADIMFHGSPCIVDRAMEVLVSAGFRRALPGEFSLRAFMAGKMDLTRAEAVAELVDSRTEAARADALRRLSGALAALVSRGREAIAEALATVHVQLDYAEDDGVPDMGLPRAALEASLAEIRGLLSSWKGGRLLREGARVAIAGRTNAGKSSLFNLLLREDRAIVSDVHGTTRDYLEGWLDLDGIPVLLYDTAGFRHSQDGIEAAGMDRSRRLLADADQVLYLVDSERGAEAEDQARIEELGGRCVRVWSRADKARAPAPEGFFPLSSLTGEGLGPLQAELSSRLRGGASVEAGGELRIASARQRDCLERAAEGLSLALEADARGEALDAVASELREALDALGELSGDVADADILDAIFSRFCVGK